MEALLVRPLSPARALLATLGIAVVGAAYCMIYRMAAGGTEPPLVALAWGLANLAPWVLAFEAAKAVVADRSLRHPAALAVLGAVLLGALLVSLAIESATVAATDPVAFRIVRRLPAAGLVLALLAAGRLLPRIRPRASSGELPLLASQIDRVTAAGNYVELHANGRAILHRMTMREADALLAPAGFVRIHRSALVNRARIVRLRPGKLRDEVELADGTRLAVGGRYRNALGPQSRHFVTPPSPETRAAL